MLKFAPKSSPRWSQILENRHHEQKIRTILGWPVGSKMEQKSIKDLMKIHVDFYNDFETIFLMLGRCWFQKPLQNEGSRVTFSTWLRICEKCDFEQPPMVLLYFSTLEAMIFYFKSDMFELFFQRRS